MPYIQGIYNNDAATWRKAKKVYVNDSGVWRDVQRAYVNDGGTWRKFWEFNSGTSGSPIVIGQEYTSGVLNFHSRDGAGAQGQSWFKYDATNGWMTRSWVHQDSGGFTGDSGWVVGNSYANANQADVWTCIPNESSGNHTPKASMNGDHYSGNWYCLWDYSGVYPTVQDVTSPPSGYQTC